MHQAAATPLHRAESGAAAFALIMLMDFSLLPPPRKSCECVSTGVSARLCHAREAVRRLSEMRSSRRKRSSCRSRFAEHDARNFVTSEVRSLLSSRGSTHTIDPGRNLCDESTNESIEKTLVFRSSPRAVTKGNGNDSLA